MLILAAVIVMAIVGADQLIKLAVIRDFALNEDRDFLKIGNLDILHLHYIENNGSAFSSFAGQRVLLLIVTVLGVAICGYLLVRNYKGRPLMYWSLVMILGGALGNMYDRVFRGGNVVDYLDVKLFDFAIFNFADCFVTVGTFLLVIYILFFMDRDSSKKKATVTTTADPEDEPDDK